MMGGVLARPLRIGTRGSKLALWQAAETARLLAAAHPALAAPGALETVVIRTTGDAVTDRPLYEIGGKGLFTKEIEAALLAGEVDVAVHSLKDVPSFLPPGLRLAAFLVREDARDCLISQTPVTGLADLPAAARVGTSSPRRAAQILAARPDLQVVSLRGNVDTRLAKIAAGEADATLLALAGLSRLGLADRATALLSEQEMLPAVAQGAIGLEIRADDADTAAWLAPLDHAETRHRVVAERAMLAALDGSCRTPIGGHARLVGDRLVLEGLVVRPDGGDMRRDRGDASISDAAALGAEIGARLKASADPRWFAGPHFEGPQAGGMAPGAAPKVSR